MYRPWWKIKLLENIYSCVWCECTFNDPSVIRFHVRVVHPFCCNSCLKSLESLEHFENHAATCSSARLDLEFYKKNIPARVRLGGCAERRDRIEKGARFFIFIFARIKEKLAPVVSEKPWLKHQHLRKRRTKSSVQLLPASMTTSRRSWIRQEKALQFFSPSTT